MSYAIKNTGNLYATDPTYGRIEQLNVTDAIVGWGMTSDIELAEIFDTYEDALRAILTQVASGVGGVGASKEMLRGFMERWSIVQVLTQTIRVEV